MKVNCKALIIMFSTQLCVYAAAPQTTQELLTEIKQSLSDDTDVDMTEAYDQSWGFANLSAPLTTSSRDSSASDLSRYWTGASTMTTETGSVSPLQAAQIFLDALLVGTGNNIDRSHIKAAMKNVIGSEDDSLVDKILDAANERSLTSDYSKIKRIYSQLFQLEQRAKNCIAYSDNANAQRTPPRFVIASSETEALERFDGYDDTTESCHKLSCDIMAEVQSGFNGQVDTIINEAADLNSQIGGLSCNVSDNTMKSLCQKIKTDSDTLLGNIGQVKNLAGVETVSNASSLTGPSQALLALFFNKAYNTGNNKQKSLTDIYSVTQDNVYTTSDEDGYKYKYRSSQPASSEINDGFAALIDNLSGLKSVPSSLMPGLPSDPNNGTLKVLVAGKLLTFKKSGALYKSTEKDGANNHVWVQPATVDDIKKLRQSTPTRYYMMRNSAQQSTIQNIMSKSTTVGILQEAKNMNTTTLTFSDGKTNPTLINRNAMQLLEESSSWRLSDKSDGSAPSWLASVGTMPNVSLLREAAVLLAEMKQMMYLQLVTNQKQLIMQSLLAASAPLNVESLKTMNEIKALNENFASGAELSTSSPPKPPTTGDLKSAGSNAKLG
ncbi:MAG: hypothetical protein VXW87_04385 [Pseudomonadota bacterium]|nr:hypothetical protein [Pseudomonadota bacterium]